MSDIKLIQLSNYVRPKIEESNAKDWVLNGKGNSFYQYIIDRNRGSVTNSAINSSYAGLIYGRGISAKDAHLKPQQWAAFMSIISPKELKKIVTDFQMFGEAALQIVHDKGHEKITGVYHLPKQKVVPNKENEDGEIEGYWYCKDWSNTSKNKPDYYPAFDTSNEEIEIYVIRTYSPGDNYFSSPDYEAGLPWAELEEEIANFCITSIKKGLTAGYIINIPNGAGLTTEQKDQLEKKIKDKLTGSPNAMSFVLNFATGDSNISVEVFPVNEQMHKQWEFLTAESRQQIMVSHKLVSPMIVGIKDNTGFGNNAEEMDTAEAQLLKRVISPKQQAIIDALKEIMLYNGINLDLYFRPLTDAAVSSIQMSAQDEKKNLDTTVADELIKMGVDEVGEDWELVETKIIENYDTDLQFTSTGTAIPNAKSIEDGEQFISRFRYVGKVSDNSRPFCRKMLAANKLYRLEDIQKMSNTVVNEGWGPRGADTYDIFLYKGGGNCHHAWQRESYRKKTDVNSPLAKLVTPAEARKAGEILPRINKTAATRPIDLPNQGFLPKIQ